MSARPLLLLSCSATKRNGVQPISAYECYDGPAYRALRASGYPHAATGPDCRLMILSAEHGLLSPWASIDAYDRMMDDARARELSEMPTDDVLRALFQPSRNRGEDFDLLPTSAIYCWGGARYRRVVKRWEERGVFRGRCPDGVRYFEGRGIGYQLGQLKAWLGTRRPDRGRAS